MIFDEKSFEHETTVIEWGMFGEYVAPPNVLSVISDMNEAERYLLKHYAEMDASLELHDEVRRLGNKAIVEGMMYLIMKYLYAEAGKPIPVLVDTINGEVDYDYDGVGEPETQWRLDSESPDEPDEPKQIANERYTDIRCLRPDYRLATSSDFNHPREAYQPWVKGFESLDTSSFSLDSH